MKEVRKVKRPRQFVKSALLGIVSTISLIAVSGCEEVREPKPPATEEVSFVVAGGVDFQSHCGTRKFDESPAGGSCVSDIDLPAVCKFEYGDPEAKFELQDPGNPKSGLCFDGSGKELGGIQKMTGYCAATYANGDREKAVAELQGDIWKCRETLDVTALCTGQYNDSRLEARVVNELWECYRPE